MISYRGKGRNEHEHSGIMPLHRICSENGGIGMIMGSSKDLQVGHHGSYFCSLLVPSAQLQEFYPVCSNFS